MTEPEPGVADVGGRVDAASVLPDEPAAGRRRLRSLGGRGLGGRTVWTFADQALSSLTNAALSILVAREVTSEAFGAFAVVLLTFSFAIGTMRAVVTDPLVIRFSGADHERWRRATAATAGAALLLGAGVGVVLVGVALLLGAPVGPALLALGLVLPGLLVQDAWRFGFFAAGRPAAATLNDLTWAVLQLLAIALLIVTDRADVVALTLAWGLSAVGAAAVGCWQVRALPDLRGGVRWFRQHLDLSTRLGTDYVVNMGAVNLATYLIGAIAGLVAVGALRAAQVLLGPLQLAFAAFTALVLPMMASRAARGRAPRGLALATSAVAGAVASLWLTLLLLLPDAVGTQLLGDSWQGARSVLLPTGLVLVAVALSTGAALGFKAIGRPGMLVRVTAVQAPLILLLGVGGAAMGGTVWAAWGLTGAQWVGCTLMWVLFARHSRTATVTGTGRDA